MVTIISSERKLVDVENGVMNRQIYYDADIYQQELERVFARMWLFIGHESQIPNPNDFFVSRMGEESVIMTRDRQNQIHVLLNTCRHRGMKVCRYDEGNTPVFSCPYHGWSYSTDGTLVSAPGELIGVPQFRTAYHGELNKEEWGLVSVPKMQVYKGGVFACWDEKAPDFFDYVGDFLPYLDGLFDHRDGREGGSVVVGGVQKWRVPCNWKFSSENFTNGAGHNISHRSVELVGIGPGGAGQTRSGERSRERNQSQGKVSFPESGHCARGGIPLVEESYPFPSFNSKLGPLDDMEAVDRYYREIYEKRRVNLAGKPVSWAGGNLFPNMSYHSQFPRSILVTHPAGPMEMEMWRWVLVDADAPKEVVDLARHHALRYSGPAGMTEQDDMENWNYAAAASKGTIAKRYPYSYKMGLGHAMKVDDLEGAIISDHTTTEENDRNFYKRWAELMDAPSWDDLPAMNRSQ